jgi:hypothetical protein
LLVHGKEKPAEDRPYAGLIFLNDEGSENGGLIFAGHKNAKGEIADSGGSLTFDRWQVKAPAVRVGDRIDAVHEGAVGFCRLDAVVGVGGHLGDAEFLDGSASGPVSVPSK